MQEISINVEISRESTVKEKYENIFPKIENLHLFFSLLYIDGPDENFV